MRHLIEFLYNRQGLLSPVVDTRRRELASIINKDCSEYINAFERLEMLEQDDRHGDSPRSDCHSWDDFLKDVNGWTAPKGYVWFIDSFEAGTAEARPLQRFQKSRLCYIHAPVMLISYLQRKLGKKNVKMIDMMKWIRTSFSSKLLHRHIFQNEGGSSELILRQFLVKRGCTKVKAWSDIETSDFEQFGPALVCGFDVYDDFEKPGKFSYGDADIPPANVKSKGQHSMVLLGVRKENEQKIFLLQNWWKGKQFVECSEEYLASCEAKAFFVKDASGIPDNLDTVDGIWAEAADIDHQESYDPED